MGLSIEEWNQSIQFDTDKNEELIHLLLGKIPKKNIEKALHKAVKPYGFGLCVNDGQIQSINLVSDKTGDEAVLLDAIAGYISDGSFYEIAMSCDEADRLVCRWDYSANSVEYSEWLVNVDEENTEISRELATESDNGDDDPEWYCGDNMIKCRSHLLQLKKLLEELPHQLEVKLVSTAEVAYLEIFEKGMKILQVSSSNTDKKSIRNYYLNGQYGDDEVLNKLELELEEKGEDLFESTSDVSKILNKLELIRGFKC